MRPIGKLATSAIVTLAFLTGLIRAASAGDASMIDLPRPLEITLALSALPAGLRNDATILVLDEDRGYKTFKEGTNGFTTLVGRTSVRFYQADWDYTYPADQLIPVAYDTAGTAHHLQPWLEIARMRAEGVPARQAKEQLKQKFADGTYTAPDKGGISYMLSPIHRAYLSPETTDEIFTVSFPHYMPYAPYVSGEQLGNFDPVTGPTALTHGMHDAGPHGYLVFMLPREQIGMIQQEYDGLLEQLCGHHKNWCLPPNNP